MREPTTAGGLAAVLLVGPCLLTSWAPWPLAGGWGVGETRAGLSSGGPPGDGAVCAFPVLGEGTTQSPQGPPEFETRGVEGAFGALRDSFCKSRV